MLTNTGSGTGGGLGRLGAVEGKGGLGRTGFLLRVWQSSCTRTGSTRSERVTFKLCLSRWAQAQVFRLQVVRVITQA
jgi:hypothetical protein